MILNLYKKKGETPLECMERYRAEHSEIGADKMTYAGRLDPLAEGELLVLTREDCKQKDTYLGRDKEYEVDVLFGFSTDTHDVMGIIQGISQPPEIEEKKVEKLLVEFVGTFSQKYPVYSSKTVGGKPLFAYAKSGELGDIEIPEKEVTIYKLELLKISSITGADLLKKIIEDVSLVRGDFRQKEILEIWNKTLAGNSEKTYPIIKIRALVSSGTYVRLLADSLGKKLAVSALALNIVRTKIMVEK